MCVWGGGVGGVGGIWVLSQWNSVATSPAGGLMATFAGLGGSGVLLFDRPKWAVILSGGEMWRKGRGEPVKEVRI